MTLPRLLNRERERERGRGGGGGRETERERFDLIYFDFFIERMAVLGRGLVFQPVLVTQTCTSNSNNRITLQTIDITDFP